MKVYSIIKQRASLLYYGWVIVTVSFFTIFISLGIRYSFSVLFIAIIKEYKWSRAEAAGAFSLAMVIHGLFSPITGFFIDRLGPRYFFPIGCIFLLIGLLLARNISNLFHLYLYIGVIIAIGINALSYSPHMSLIPKWFIKKRGLASGLVLSGIGMGAFLIVPLVEFIIQQTGWRMVFVFFSLCIIALIPITFLLHRNNPKEIGQFPDGIEPLELKRTENFTFNKNLQFPQQMWTFSNAFKTKAFWCMMLMLFCNGLVSNMLIVHQAIYIVDLGHSEMKAASMVGIVALLGSLGGIFCGHISDRMGREFTYTVASSIAFIGILFLLFLKHSSSAWPLIAFVIFYGIGYGSLFPLNASTTGDLFPGNSLGRILATQSIAFGLGGGLGPFMGGYFHDKMGTYTIPFSFLLLIIILGVIGIWIAGPRHIRVE